LARRGCALRYNPRNFLWEIVRDFRLRQTTAGQVVASKYRGVVDGGLLMVDGGKAESRKQKFLKFSQKETKGTKEEQNFGGGPLGRTPGAGGH
jgi:hypothetical protein